MTEFFEQEHEGAELSFEGGEPDGPNAELTPEVQAEIAEAAEGGAEAEQHLAPELPDPAEQVSAAAEAQAEERQKTRRETSGKYVVLLSPPMPDAERSFHPLRDPDGEIAYWPGGKSDEAVKAALEHDQNLEKAKLIAANDGWQVATCPAASFKPQPLAPEKPERPKWRIG